MSVAFYVLAVWLIVSIPTALLWGWACGLNERSLERDELPLVEGPAPSRTGLEADRSMRELDAAA